MDRKILIMRIALLHAFKIKVKNIVKYTVGFGMYHANVLSEAT